MGSEATIIQVPIDNSWIPGGSSSNPGATMSLGPNGLTLYGSGYRAGTWILSAQHFDITAPGSVIQYQWQANGGGIGWGYGPNDYMGVDIGVAWNSDQTQKNVSIRPDYLTPNHSWDGSTVVSPDTWYYTTITVDAVNHALQGITASGNYYDNGGTIIRSETANLDSYGYWQYMNDVQIFAGMGDNYGANTSRVTLSQVIVNTNQNPNTIPEPATWLLFITGLAGLIRTRLGRL